jgi:hypothetical protein
MGTGDRTGGQKLTVDEVAEVTEGTEVQGFSEEPEVGLEPTTCRLQGGCSTS